MARSENRATRAELLATAAEEQAAEADEAERSRFRRDHELERAVARGDAVRSDDRNSDRLAVEAVVDGAGTERLRFWSGVLASVTVT